MSAGALRRGLERGQHMKLARRVPINGECTSRARSWNISGFQKLRLHGRGCDGRSERPDERRGTAGPSVGRDREKRETTHGWERWRCSTLVHGKRQRRRLERVRPHEFVRCRFVARDFKRRHESPRNDLCGAMPPLEAKKTLCIRNRGVQSQEGPREVNHMFVDVNQGGS